MKDAPMVHRTPSANSAGPRLRRMLSMIPWLAANNGPTVAEVCRRYGLTAAALQADLDLLTYHVGIPPYSPDSLFEMNIHDGRVFAVVTPTLDRPLRLTPAEGLSLVAAGAALVHHEDPEGPLATGLAKIAALLGLEREDAVEIDLGGGDRTVLSTLQDAVAAGQRVIIDHHNDARDEWLERTVDPWRVTHAHGAWYLTGFDGLRQDQRSFRIDRIRSARNLDETVTHRAPDDLVVDLQPGQDADRVVVLLAPSARWVIDSYPTDDVQVQADGRLRVTLGVNGPAWLARLLLRLGPAATVVDGPPELQSAGVSAAQKILQRYGVDPSS